MNNAHTSLSILPAHLTMVRAILTTHVPTHEVWRLDRVSPAAPRSFRISTLSSLVKNRSHLQSMLTSSTISPNLTCHTKSMSLTGQRRTQRFARLSNAIASSCSGRPTGDNPIPHAVRSRRCFQRRLYRYCERRTGDSEMIQEEDTQHDGCIHNEHH